MSTPRLQITRTFNWGLLLINDRGSGDLAAEAPTASAVAVATRSTAAIAVRHAQDTDLGDGPATVTIEVFVGVESAALRTSTPPSLSSVECWRSATPKESSRSS